VRARLYIGFSTKVNLKEKDESVIEFTPQVYVRENVLDYVNLRREICASANAITRSQDNRFMETLEEDQFDKRYNLKPRKKT